ncbi:MAG: hypothetical protein Q4G45_09015 [Actinomycetia bacterium]|nr:hypothetical protein [Actinomycetes bacterium]
MLLPTKGISPDRALLSVGGTLVELLQTPATVSGLWERFQARTASQGRGQRVTFDWFALALSMLFAVGVVRWNDAHELERCRVPA